MACEDNCPEDDSADAAVLMYDLLDLMSSSHYHEAANYNQILKKRFNKNIPTVYLRNKFDVDVSKDEWVKKVKNPKNFRISALVATSVNLTSMHDVSNRNIYAFSRSAFPKREPTLPTFRSR